MPGLPHTVDMLLATGQAAQAEALCRSHLEQNPADAEIVQKLGLVLLTLRRGADALPYFDRVAGHEPASADFWANYATLLPDAGRRADSEHAFRRSLEIDPAHYGALVGLSAVLRDRSQLSDAETFAREAVARHPGRWECVVNLSSVLLASGRPDDAVGLVRDAIARLPGAELDLLPSLLNASNYSDRLSRDEVFENHRRFGTILGVSPAPLRSFLNSRDPERRLRVGLLSPDLRAHSVAYFVRSLLAHRDPERLEIACYSTAPGSDAMTDLLRALADRWTDAGAMNDAQLLKTIRSDKVDVLVELSGHTSGDRLRMLAKRAAPVQITYCGYPNTTGVPAIDYRLVDHVTDPPGAEIYATEKLLRLDPCMLCYAPADEIPGAVQSPERQPSDHDHAGATAGVRLGSFNALSKLSSRTLDLWASILAELPDATLFMKNGAFADIPTRQRVTAELGTRGIAPERLDLVAWAPTPREGLELYNRVDICLDSFPYTGTTTTCESLLMGAPVVTLKGTPHAARVSSSLLAAVGLPELIARDEAEYRGIVLALARSPDRRRQLRATTRPKLLSSTLCDGPSFATRFEATVRSAWRDVCAAEASR